MRAETMARAGIALALFVSVSACSSNPGTMHIERGRTTPDEFAILPNKPIEVPNDLAALPPPTPLGANRTDVNPQAEAVAALGGNPSRVVRDGRITDDPALVRQATRYGVQPNVRVELAQADVEFRRRHRGRLLERWFQVPTYYNSFEKEELNQHGTLQLFRNAGAPTPGAPPEVSEFE